MSGHGGGGGGGGGSDDTPQCDKLTTKVILNSPDSKVLNKLKVGDVLIVQLQKPTGPVVVVTRDGKVAGSITSAILTSLIRCLELGNQYVAEVLELSAGKCQVLIRPGTT
jgi:hypothetical protein